MIILGKSEAAITMILDILVSRSEYCPITILNNLSVDSPLPYDNGLFDISEVKEVESIGTNQFIVIGAMLPATKYKLVDLYNPDRNACPTLINKTAHVSSTAIIGLGILIDALANVSSYAKLSDFVTVYAGATISHHSTVGAFSTICPNASIAGNVTIGERTLIGIGACVKNGVKIGANCTIGAGAVVVRDVPDNTVVKGNPAK